MSIRFMVSAVTCVMLAAGCHRDMRDQPRYDTYEASEFFSDGQSARPLVAGTVARGQLREDEVFYTGKRDDKFVAELPMEVDRAFLERGQNRFNIYCTPCHAAAGTGDGMIVQRGFRRPPSYHIDRLRNAPAGHFYDVISQGFGAMPSFAIQLEPRDRWAIAAYIRALQLSQNASLEDVPASERKQFEEAGR